MPALTLKNIPDEVYESLKERASANRRSLNREAIVCLERVLLPSRLSADEILDDLDALRADRAIPPADEALLAEARESGRP